MKTKELVKLLETEEQKMCNENRYGTAKSYRSTRRSFSSFIKTKEISDTTVDEELIKKYESYLRNERCVCMNTISFYIRVLHTVSILDIFNNVFTGSEKTAKRALRREDMEKIVNTNLGKKKHLEKSRLIFLLIYLLQGISFVDLANLKKSDLKNGRLIYRRKKTNQTISIKWTTKMQTILDRIGESKNDYLLPIMKGKVSDFHKQYQSQSTIFNRHLKEIAKIAGIDVSLTSYMARHTWATDAYRESIDIATIGSSLGHTSERTTRIYLAELDMSEKVDKANEVTTGWMETEIVGLREGDQLFRTKV